MSKVAWSRFLVRAPQQRVLVIGDVMLDRYVNGAVTRISPEDPTCLVLDHEPPIVRRLGGAANVALNVAALGAQATLIGLGGERRYREQFHATIQATSSSLPGSLGYNLTNGHRKFTVKTRYCANGKQLLRVDYEERRIASDDENQQLRQLYIDAVEQIADPAPSIAILSDYAKGVFVGGASVCSGANADNSFLTWLTSRLQLDNIRYVVDPKKTWIEDYGKAMVICPNNHEWAVSLQADHKPLSEHVVVTDGARGCMIMPWRAG